MRKFFVFVVLLLVSVSSFGATNNFWTASAQGDLEGVKRYVEKIKIDINKKDDKGFGALSYAAYFGKTEIIRYLLENGADINLIDSQGGTPICYAIDRGDIPSFRLMLSNPSLKLDVPMDVLLFAKSNPNLEAQIINTSAAMVVNNVETTSKDISLYVSNIIEYSIASTEIVINFQKVASSITSFFGGAGTSKSFYSTLRVRSLIISQLLSYNAEEAHLTLHLKTPDSFFFAFLFRDKDTVTKAIQDGRAPSDFEISVLFVIDGFAILDYLYDAGFLKLTDTSKYLFPDAQYSLTLISYLTQKGYDASKNDIQGTSLFELTLPSVDIPSIDAILSATQAPAIFISGLLKSAKAVNRKDIIDYMAGKGYSEGKDVVLDESDLYTLLVKKDSSVYDLLLNKGYTFDSKLNHESLSIILIRQKETGFLDKLLSKLPPASRDIPTVEELFSIVKLGDPKLLDSYLQSSKNPDVAVNTNPDRGLNALIYAIQFGRDEDTNIELIKVLLKYKLNLKAKDSAWATDYRKNRVAMFIKSQLQNSASQVAPPDTSQGATNNNTQGGATDAAILGQWGKNNEPVLRFPGAILIHYDFRADGTVVLNELIKDNTILREGSKGTFKASNGKGMIYRSNNTTTSFTYQMDGDFLLLREGGSPSTLTFVRVAGPQAEASVSPQAEASVSPQAEASVSPQAAVSSKSIPSPALSIDKTIIGKWGLSPAMVKASGTNMIAYDFHADGTVIRMIVIKDSVVQVEGMAPVKFQANNGNGQLESGSKNPINFTYSTNGDVLKFDSDDPIYGAKGLHQTLYRVVE